MNSDIYAALMRANTEVFAKLISADPRDEAALTANETEFRRLGDLFNAARKAEGYTGPEGK
jgi:hypothetical protein